jgi:hypothetical protein
MIFWFLLGVLAGIGFCVLINLIGNQDRLP